MRAVNLLPEDTNSSRFGNPGTIPIAGTAAALLAIGVVAALAHVESGAVTDKQARLNDLQQQLSQVQKPAAKAGTAGAVLLTSRDGRIGALNSALTGRVPFETVLHQLAAVLPEDTWFDSLSMNSPTAAAPAGSTPAAAGTPTTSGVTLTGYTASPESVARVLQRLTVVPSLSDVKLTTTQRSTVGKKEMFQFTITANISSPGGAS